METKGEIEDEILQGITESQREVKKIGNFFIKNWFSFTMLPTKCPDSIVANESTYHNKAHRTFQKIEQVKAALKDLKIEPEVLPYFAVDDLTATRFLKGQKWDVQSAIDLMKEANVWSLYTDFHLMSDRIFSEIWVHIKWQKIPFKTSWEKKKYFGLEKTRRVIHVWYSKQQGKFIFHYFMEYQMNFNWISLQTFCKGSWPRWNHETGYVRLLRGNQKVHSHLMEFSNNFWIEPKKPLEFINL